jgi:hypothetical protein
MAGAASWAIDQMCATPAAARHCVSGKMCHTAVLLCCRSHEQPPGIPVKLSEPPVSIHILRACFKHWWCYHRRYVVDTPQKQLRVLQMRVLQRRRDRGECAALLILTLKVSYNPRRSPSYYHNCLSL